MRIQSDFRWCNEGYDDIMHVPILCTQILVIIRCQIDRDSHRPLRTLDCFTPYTHVFCNVDFFCKRHIGPCGKRGFCRIFDDVMNDRMVSCISKYVIWHIFEYCFYYYEAATWDPRLLGQAISCSYSSYSHDIWRKRLGSVSRLDCFTLLLAKTLTEVI